MTLQAVRELLESTRNGIVEQHYGDCYTDDMLVTRRPTAHEAALYSICEGLLVELERIAEHYHTYDTDDPYDEHGKWEHDTSGPKQREEGR